MLPFLAIFGAGLCGYALVPAYSWLAAAFGLASVSWARHYVLIRRGVDAGLDDPLREALLRSSFNAFIATGACYWVGVAVRSASVW
jgi:hypothetical protein